MESLCFPVFYCALLISLGFLAISTVPLLCFTVPCCALRQPSNVVMV